MTHFSSGGADTTYEALRAEADRSVSVTLALLDAFRRNPELPGARHEVRTLSEAHPEDVRVQLSATAALNALAERSPPDEPPSPDGPASDAIRYARRALESSLSTDVETTAYLWVNLANAHRFMGEAHDHEAEEAYQTSLATLDRGGTHYDLGLFYKWRGRFDAAQGAFRQAHRRLGDRRDVLFNLAIVSTALSDGAEAQRAYARLGIDVRIHPSSGMPETPTPLPEVEVRIRTRPSGYGFEPAKLTGKQRFEVLPVAPLSPCHGVLVAPSFGDGALDFGDVVLFDVAPISVREANRPIPLFPVLAKLGSGRYHRFRFVALEQTSGDLVRTKLPDGASIFPQRAMVQSVCPRCAAGDYARHAHEPPMEHRVVHGKITAGHDVPLAVLRDAIDRAMAEEGRVRISVPALHEAMRDTPRAGEARKTWMALERSAVRRTARPERR